MNPVQYKKLSRHFTAHETFCLDLTEEEAIILSKKLPKGCSLAIQMKIVTKQTHVKSKVFQHHTHAVNQKINLSKSTKQIHQNNKISVIKGGSKKLTKQQINELIKACMKILQQLRNSEYAWPFLQPVDAESLGIPEYYEIIRQPMDLKTIEKKSKSLQYQNMRDFYDDVSKIIKNSYVFNEGNEDFIKITVEFQKYYNKIRGVGAQGGIDNKIVGEKVRQKQKQKQKGRENIKQKEKQKGKQKQKLKIKQKQKQIQKDKEKEKQKSKQKDKKQNQNTHPVNKPHKKKKRTLPKDMIDAQNISLQEKLELAKNIQSLPKQYIKGIRQIVFQNISHKHQVDQISKQLNILMPFQENCQEFDIERIGYKKIRELQKYVKNKLIQVEGKENKMEKKVQVDLDELESEWTESFVI